MCVVKVSKDGKLCLHQTHLKTCLAASAPLFNQCDCQALCLPLIAPEEALFDEWWLVCCRWVCLSLSSPNLVISDIFSKALVASLVVSLFLPFQSPANTFFGDRLAAATAAKYGLIGGQLGVTGLYSLGRGTFLVGVMAMSSSGIRLRLGIDKSIGLENSPPSPSPSTSASQSDLLLKFKPSFSLLLSPSESRRILFVLKSNTEESSVCCWACAANDAANAGFPAAKSSRFC